MRFMAILDHRLFRPSPAAAAGNFERLLASLWRDAADAADARDVAAPRPAHRSAALCPAATDPLLLAEWLRAEDELQAGSALAGASR